MNLAGVRRSIRLWLVLKQRRLSHLAGSEDIIIKQLFDEIKKLDAVYDQAMRDLKELGPNERVINTIFNTYEQKIRLLELIILETNKINSHENNEQNYSLEHLHLLFLQDWFPQQLHQERIFRKPIPGSTR